MKKYNFKRIGAAAAAAVMLTVSGCLYILTEKATVGRDRTTVLRKQQRK